MQSEEALCERFQGAEEDKQDHKRTSTHRSEGDIEDYMT
jgi:hypothetical protein